MKRVGLTVQGQKVVDHAKREIWPLVEHAVAEICEGLDGPLLEQLGAIEEALTSKPLIAVPVALQVTRKMPEVFLTSQNSSPKGFRIMRDYALNCAVMNEQIGFSPAIFMRNWILKNCCSHGHEVS